MVQIAHYGTVVFDKGQYRRESGSASWDVRPVPGFGVDPGPPLGMVHVVFETPAPGAYSVIVSPQRTGNTPTLGANAGNIAPEGFVVHIFEAISTRTLQNGSFSFVVLADER